MILDVASGTAGVALQLERRAGVKVVGVDLTEAMLRQGRRRVAAAGKSNRIGLVAGRAEQLPFPDRHFDALTFTYLLRYVQDPQATLAELARVLRPGGTMASLEFCAPAGPVWGPAWWAYTRLLLPAGGLALGGREWYRVGRFLGPNISAHYRRYPVSWTVQAWQKAGFTDVSARDHEPGRRPGHVGHACRLLTRRRTAPPSGRPITRPGRGDGGTGGRCCTRRTRPGTCPTR